MIDQIFYLILFNELETSQRDYAYTLACDYTHCVIQENPEDHHPPEGLSDRPVSPSAGGQTRTRRQVISRNW